MLQKLYSKSTDLAQKQEYCPALDVQTVQLERALSKRNLTYCLRGKRGQQAEVWIPLAQSGMVMMEAQD